MKLISRDDARIDGLLRYFTGKDCKHGHICERYTLGGGCVQCAKQANMRLEGSDIGKAKRKYYNLKARSDFLIVVKEDCAMIKQAKERYAKLNGE